jgi:8-oxo-dGTP diphosphatase
MKPRLLRGTLVLLEDKKVRGNIILAKKKHKVGIGCWCGYGGKIERGETIRAAAIRELKQETKPTPHSRPRVHARQQDLLPIARVDFYNKHGRKGAYTFRVYVYLLKRWKGRPVESAEMGPPRSFNRGRLPHKEMMAGDKHWLPLVLRGKPIIASVWYGKDQHTLTRRRFACRPATAADLARF